MVLKVNPNRMELMKLKKSLKLAQKGHKLLKDKQEQLIRNFFEIIKANKELRKTVEEKLIKAYKSFLVAKAVMGEEKIEEAVMMPTLTTDIKYGKQQIMNLKVPTFDVVTSGEILSFGLSGTSVELDNSVKIFSQVIRDLLILAEKEKAIIELANEIINTRRRVNALEYILVPNLKETIKYIGNKLNEMERSNISRLMKIKNMVQEVQ
ncbi:MAG TPA: V-type ATP synthase subunit D [Spirochaetia bacterium]|nr:MAG: V-type ATP synthase subunit D [Spirochaetes bacterium GWB1_36_13]HCL57372.1 V-type ATP synthase subunit D [Spirochaetia bacterium]